MKISDLLEAEKLDGFLPALVSNVQVQLELRGPTNFQEVWMYAERANSVMTRVSGQDLKKGTLNPQYHHFERHYFSFLRRTGPCGRVWTTGPLIR